MKYIEQLPVSEAVRGQLRLLGAETPEALLGLIEAAPAEFERLAGGEEAKRIRAALLKMAQWHPRAMESPAREFGLGAGLENAPGLSHPGYDLEKRDRLHAEMVRLQAQDPVGNRSRIAELEKELNALLDDRFP